MGFAWEALRSWHDDTSNAGCPTFGFFGVVKWFLPTKVRLPLIVGLILQSIIFAVGHRMKWKAKFQQVPSSRTSHGNLGLYIPVVARLWNKVFFTMARNDPCRIEPWNSQPCKAGCQPSTPSCWPTVDWQGFSKYSQLHRPQAASEVHEYCQKIALFPVS